MQKICGLKQCFQKADPNMSLKAISQPFVEICQLALRFSRSQKSDAARNKNDLILIFRAKKKKKIKAIFLIVAIATYLVLGAILKSLNASNFFTLIFGPLYLYQNQ